MNNEQDLEALLAALQSQPSALEVAMQQRIAADVDPTIPVPQALQSALDDFHALAASGEATTEELWEKRRQVAEITDEVSKPDGGAE